MTPTERAQSAHAAVRGEWQPNRRVVFGDVSVRVVEFTRVGSMVELRVDQARRVPGGESVQIDGHYRVVNPPTLVPDPAGPIERTDNDGTVIGRFRQDPGAALRDVVAGVIGREL